MGNGRRSCGPNGLTVALIWRSTNRSGPHEGDRLVLVEIVGGGVQLGRDIIDRSSFAEQSNGLRQQAARDHIPGDAPRLPLFERRGDVPGNELMRSHGQILPPFSATSAPVLSCSTAASGWRRPTPTRAGANGRKPPSR